MGFELNPYDSCVDDLKISHAENNVVETLIDMLNTRYGTRTPMTVTRGKIHDYLGMKIDYSIPGKMKTIMKDYIG
jgi:hypothetical protein